MGNGRVVGTIREGVANAGEIAQDVIGDVADRIEDVLDRAEARGRKVTNQVKKELTRRWRQVDRAGRDNAFILAFGALALGVLVGYLLTRDSGDE
jgi:ElaB/YqjD/DUF883 family membrane-anchored ribosome-binding protein